jgi:GT2 family glycosyltransferase
LTDFENFGIVVIGRNEGQRLIDCLASLQSYAGPTIIYVDSASTDGSVAAANAAGAAVVALDASVPFTAARARNEGLARLLELKPATQLVQFIDGDCVLVSSWLETALDFMRSRKDVAVVCGRRRERYPERSVYNRLCDLEWNTPVGEAGACGGDSLMRVDAFKKAGRFRAELVSGEEPELCGRIRDQGWKVWRLDAEMTRHDAAMLRFGQWWRRAVRSGYGQAEILWLRLPSRTATREKTEVVRALFWAGLVPLLIGAGTLFNKAALAGVLIYPLQICQIALRRGGGSADSWIYALFVTIAKFPQLQGNLKYWRQCWRGQSVRTFEYK